MAPNSRRTCGLIFYWLYPVHLPLLSWGITHWTDTPEVTTPSLKFVAEFVLNEAQRMTFDSSSPNGILLFREVSKLIVAYGTRILSLPNVADIYAFKYKGIWISLTILSRALAGTYVNFGVFELYRDMALSDVLDIALKMALSIPLADILAYRKILPIFGIPISSVLVHDSLPAVVFDVCLCFWTRSKGTDISSEREDDFPEKIWLKLISRAHQLVMDGFNWAHARGNALNHGHALTRISILYRWQLGATTTMTLSNASYDSESRCWSLRRVVGSCIFSEIVAHAMATHCFWPPDNCTPFPPD